jgi:lysophospholipase L1-like esterase
MPMVLRASCFVLWLLGWPVLAPAQGSRALDSLQARYPFLNTGANRIENAQIGLQRFYEKLVQLPLQPAALPGSRVSIVHLGDSHLQADELTDEVRQQLQRRHGNAGRGLVFPYRLARTNGSSAYFTRLLGGSWRTRRLTGRPDTARWAGLSGLSVATNDSGAGFALRISLLRRPTGQFNQLTLLRQPGPAAFDWQARTAGGRLLGTIPGAAPGVAQPLPLDSLRSYVELRTTRAHASQTRALLYGLLLDNGQPGLIYHSMGVNGAAVRHYNQTPRYFEQLPALAPDLFIVSLGTNDAYSAGFDTAVFRRQLDTLVTRLRRRCPRADVLLTGPPDSYRARRYRNPDLARLRAVLRDYAQEHDLAYWDVSAVQGGYGSMRTWLSNGLAANDLVHFSSAGYRLQGHLLYLAIQDGFASFTR